jgi:hypothetical protein
MLVGVVLSFFLVTLYPKIMAHPAAEQNHYQIFATSLFEDCDRPYIIIATPLNDGKCDDMTCTAGSFADTSVEVSASGYCTTDLVSVVRSGFSDDKYYGMLVFDGTSCDFSRMTSMSFLIADGETCVPAEDSKFSDMSGQIIHRYGKSNLNVTIYDTADCSGPWRERQSEEIKFNLCYPSGNTRSSHMLITHEYFIGNF